MFYIAGLYKFKKISNIKKNKKILQVFFIKKSIRGTIIISSEGINGTISANKNNLNLTLNKIKRIFKFNNFDSQSLSKSEFQVFLRGKVKLKKKLCLWALKFLRENQKIM